MSWYQLVTIGLPMTIVLYSGTHVQAVSAPMTAAPMSDMDAPPSLLKQTPHKVIASWYGRSFAGRLTTSGERFDPLRFTAASTTMPLGSVVKVENPQNGRSVSVRINDCGPYVRNRDLDLSLRAAQKIGIDRQGVARLMVTLVKIPAYANTYRCMSNG